MEVSSTEKESGKLLFLTARMFVCFLKSVFSIKNQSMEGFLPVLKRSQQSLTQYNNFTDQRLEAKVVSTSSEEVMISSVGLFVSRIT